MKPSKGIRNAVLGMYQDFWTGSIDNFFPDSEGALMVGTGPGEIWRGGTLIRAALKAQAELVERIRILPGEIVTFEEGSMGGCLRVGIRPEHEAFDLFDRRPERHDDLVEGTMSRTGALPTAAVTAWIWSSVPEGNLDSRK